DPRRRAARVPRPGRGQRRAREAAGMKRTLAEFARACGGRLSGGDAAYTDVVSDSRTLTAQQLFVALRGPRFDGHDFLAAALALGAAGALVDAERPVKLPQIIVPDTQAALERAARAWRAHFRGALVGVAGSNGKTTAKEMTAAILAQAGSCLATRGNLNNHIGVPLTLLRLTPAHRFAVVEMGANRAGEVAALVAIARPTIGVITNAGAEHLEGFGSLEAAASAGASLEHIAAGLAALRAVPGRLQFKQGASGAWLIDDSYNANPSSVRAAIEVLGSLAGRRWLVLGDMAELGEFAHAAHSEIGEFARAHGVERLYATGALAARAVDSFGAGAQWFPDAAALTAALSAELGRAGPEVRLLIKGSRMNRLERVVDALAA